MPWLVVVFGLMIAPLGVVSIFFIVIQPILLGTWSTLALVAAAAMLIQIPYSLDELLATLQFVRRRSQAGRNWLRVFFRGDTDSPDQRAPDVDELDAPARTLLSEMVAGGVGLPWNLALAACIGLSLLFTRLTLGTEDGLADAHHLIGALVLTVVSIAAADVARPVRLLNVPLGAALIAVPFVYGAAPATMITTVLSGIAIAALSVRRGPIRARYGAWDRRIV
jgi:hypothetical protein